MRYLVQGISSAVWMAGMVLSYQHHIETIPAAEANSPSIADYISSHDGLDKPHVTPINESAYDWWYFDAYSEDLKTSVVVVFFNAPTTGFVLAGAPPNDITQAAIFVSLPDNPYFVYGQNISSAGATVDYAGNGASGVWTGSGCSFTGQPDLSEYTVNIDYPPLGYKGSLSFKSTAPAHYPCDRAKSGVSMAIMPNVGWSNAIPDGVSEVHLNIDGTRVDFTGVGYHDKNWGDKPFTSTVGSWFWGHGQLGPYSIVWYDALTPSGSEHVSAYVSKDDNILVGSCAPHSIRVRPSGAGDPYPPSLSAPNPPSGKFHIEIDLDDGGGGGGGGSGEKLVVDVEPVVEVVAIPGQVGQIYDRWTGRLSGGVVGGKGKEVVYEGTALYEQFTFT